MEPLDSLTRRCSRDRWLLGAPRRSRIGPERASTPSGANPCACPRGVYPERIRGGGPDALGPAIPPLTMFRVFDVRAQASDSEAPPTPIRILMAVVYRDVESAQAARNRIESPELVFGYGESVWSSNVALVQSTPQALAERYTEQYAEEEEGLAPAAGGSTAFANAPTVDDDFIATLRNADRVNL